MKIYSDSQIDSQLSLWSLLLYECYQRKRIKGKLQFFTKKKNENLSIWVSLDWDVCVARNEIN